MTSNYEISVKLPSGGKIYADDKLSGPITLTMITTKDEKKIFGSSDPEKALREIVKNHTIPSVDPDNLIPGDYLYLLFMLRSFSYGDDYSFNTRCPECGTEEDFLYNITEVPLNTDEVQREYLTKLPVNGDTVGWRVLLQSDINSINKELEDSKKKIKSFDVKGERYILIVSKALTSLNGEPFKAGQSRDYVESLVGKDSAYIRSKMRGIKVGLSATVQGTCSACGHKMEVPVVMNSEFFRPEFNDDSTGE